MSEKRIVAREEELKRSVERLQALIDEAPITVVNVDIKGKITYVNKDMLQRTGYSREELVGKNGFRLGLFPHETMKLLGRRMQEKLMGKAPSPLEMQFKRKDGEWMWVEIRGKALWEHGAPVGVQIMAQDITERKRMEEALAKSHDELEIRVQQRTAELAKANEELRNEITERKRAEEQLRESEAKFKTIVENIRDVVFQLSPLGIIQYVSPKVQEVYGYKPEDLVGKHFKKTTPVSELVKALDALKSVLSGKVISNLEVNQLDSKGKIIPMEINIAPVRREGKIIAVQGVMRDITERKRAEEALAKSHDELEIRVQQRTAELAKANEELRNEITERKRAEEALQQSEENLRAYLESAPDGVYLNDLKGTFLYGNKKAEEITAYKREELVGKSLLKLNLLPAKHLAKASKLLALNAIGRPTGPDELELIRKDGSRIWTEIATTPIKQQGKAVVIGFVRDITKRKRLEEELEFRRKELEDIMWNVIDGIGVSDVQGKIIQANRALAEMHGYDSPDEVIGRPFFDFVAKEDLPRIAERFQEMMVKKEKTIKNIEMIGLKKDGSKFPEMLNITNSWDKDGSPTGSFAVVHDITEHKRVEEELQKTIAELERSNAELERFAHIASHDLQEPLRMVASYTQLLEKRYKDRLDADAHDFIGYAVDGAKRMQQLINDLLTYSRVGTRGKPFEPTDCMTVFEAAIANLDVTIRESSAEVTSDPLPPVMADGGQLVQLFQNLIDNAVKFNGEEPPRVHVSVEQKGDEWVFSVRDNGIGIDSQYLERAFMVFQRLHSGKYRGTGIGLSIGKRIVERHGGRIWLESQPGKGTTVHFTIPVKGGKQS